MKRAVTDKNDIDASNLKLDLASISLEEFREIRSSIRDALVLRLPLPSIGKTNMHIDICSDFIDAAWSADRLASHAESAEVEEIQSDFDTEIQLTLKGVKQTIQAAIEDCILVFQGDETGGYQQRYQTIRDEIADFEDNIDTFKSKFPQLIDSYYANLVNGAYYQFRYDAPDYYDEQIKKFPERQIGFHRSAFSTVLERNCYVSEDSWLIPADMAVDEFFRATEQKIELSQFQKADVFAIGGRSFVKAEGLVVYFPMSRYFKSRICASFDMRDQDDDAPPDLFENFDRAFPFSSSKAELSASIVQAPRGNRPLEWCLVHETGALIMIDDGIYRHPLYGTKPLNPIQIKQLHGEITELSLKVMAGLGVAPQEFPWGTLSDDDFERLCYDILVAHPKFDADTVRKLGKSRSRDGGRDIQANEVSRTTQIGKKWIFQCKLVTDGSSLSARKVTDIGDMLDMYAVEGFGVMTNALIDATLYDKCEAVCRKRGIDELHFSGLEIERALVRNAAIRVRYFSEG